MIFAVVSELGALGWGFLLQRTAGLHRTPRQWPLAWVIGTAAELLVLYAFAAGEHFPRAAPLVLTTGGIVALMATRRPRGSSCLRAIRLWRPRPKVVDIALATVLALPLALILIRGVVLPPSGWDGLGLWTAKAGVLVHGEGLRSEAFTEPLRFHPHKGYPIGLPLLLARNAAWSGRIDLLGVSRSLTLIAGLLMWTMLAVVGEVAGLRTALLGLALLLWTVPWARGLPHYHLTSGFVDPVLGLAVAVAGCSITLWTVCRRSDVLAAGALATVVVASLKNEGLPWSCLLLSVTVLAGIYSVPKVRRHEWMLIAASLASIVGMRLAHLHLRMTSQLRIPSIDESLDASTGEAVDALNHILMYMPRLLAERYTHLIALTCLGLFVLLLGAPRCKRLSTRIMVLLPFGWLAVIVLVLVVVQIQIGRVIGWFNLVRRLLEQGAPVTLMLGIMLLAAAREVGDSDRSRCGDERSSPSESAGE